MDLRSAASQPGSLWFSVLGPLTAEIGGAPVPLGAPKQKLVLAMLLCRANTPVSVDLLTTTLWEDAPPRTARKNVQVYVTALRKLLDAACSPDRLWRRCTCRSCPGLSTGPRAPDLPERRRLAPLRPAGPPAVDLSPARGCRWQVTRTTITGTVPVSSLKDREPAGMPDVTMTSLAGLSGVGYARLSSSTGMVRTPAVWRAYSAKPG